MSSDRVVLLLADACWIALASLQRERPSQEGFETKEVLQRIQAEELTAYPRSSIYAHLHQHCVANAEPSSGKYRMFTRLPDGRLRLFRPGDYTHPKRHGKTHPEVEAVPAAYRELLDWYQQVYAQGRSRSADPVLAMRGVGKALWRGVDSDAYVAELREGWSGE